MNARYVFSARRVARFTPLVAAMTLGLSGVASAATLTVNSSASISASGKCTLADAVAAVNRGSIARRSYCKNSGGAFGDNDTIVFQKNFAIAFAVPADGADSALVLKNPLTISGAVSQAGAPLVTIARSSKATAPFRLIESTSNLTLHGVALSGGRVDGDGGGVLVSGNASLQLIDAAVVDNVASGRGGGIYADASVVLDNSSVSGNVAVAAGGGIYSYLGEATLVDATVSGNDGGGLGGGLAVGAVQSQGATISGNSADVGGGVYTLMPSRLSNTTVSGNAARISGGGIYASGAMTLSFSTVASNSVGSGGAGAGLVVFFDGNSATATIISSNSGGSDVDGPYRALLGGDHDLVGTVGRNIRLPADTLRCAAGLAPLMNDGGPTLTQPPGPQSCAIDAGPATTSLPVDQRGMPRRVGAHTDIGAVEKQGANDPPAG